MTIRPWLTIVMPVHQGEDWLEATLDSLVRQPVDGIELIAIDSSPDDRSCTLLERYAGRLDLRLHHRPDLKPWTDKTNVAVAMAGADHVAMLHQDDFWLDGRVAALKRWIAIAPDAAVHFAPTLIVDAQGAALGPWRCPLPAGAVDRELLLERLLVQNFVSVPAPLFRRDAWTAVGGMDPDLWYTADWDLWLKLARAGPAYAHDDVTTGFRVHGGSLTMTGSRDRAAFEQQMRSVLDRHLHAIPAARAARVRGPAQASIAINTALAAAAGGSARALLSAVIKLVWLGPAGIARYLHCSRILDRALPRLRAKLAGSF